MLFSGLKLSLMREIYKDPIVQLGIFLINRIDFFVLHTLTVGQVGQLKVCLLSSFLLIAYRYSLLAGNRQYLISAIKVGLMSATGLVIGVLILSEKSKNHPSAGAYHVITVGVNRVFGKLKFVICFSNSLKNLPAGYNWISFVVGGKRSNLESVRELFRFRSFLSMLSYAADESAGRDLMLHAEGKENLFDGCTESDDDSDGNDSGLF